jgi:hypothetical protein
VLQKKNNGGTDVSIMPDVSCMMVHQLFAQHAVVAVARAAMHK